MRAHRNSPPRFAACLVVVAFACAGCATPGDLGQDLLRSLHKQTDPELVREGAPAYLLLLDALVERAPDDADLLVAAAEANTTYALSFLARGEDEARARDMLTKAKAYGLRVLSEEDAFRKVMHAPIERFETVMGAFDEGDVPALYATANAWALWILRHRGIVDAGAEFPKVLALMRRVSTLSPAYRRGGPDVFFGIYFAVQAAGSGGDLDRSREHFLRAIDMGGSDCLMNQVAYAEYYARRADRKDLFERTLRKVLVHSDDPPDIRLMNAVARRRASQLLRDADKYF